MELSDASPPADEPEYGDGASSPADAPPEFLGGGADDEDLDVASDVAHPEMEFEETGAPVVFDPLVAADHALATDLCALLLLLPPPPAPPPPLVLLIAVAVIMMLMMLVLSAV